MKDDDEIDSENEQAALRKKKKRLPFYAKVGGGLARHRADRKAYRRGGMVKSKADGEPISPNEPNAPAGGAVRQKFQEGGAVPPGFGPAMIRTRGQMRGKTQERPALPNVELERPSIKEIEMKGPEIK